MQTSDCLRALPAMVVLAAASAWPAWADTVLPDVEIHTTHSAADRAESPATTESITAERARATTNVANTEDMLKYLPGVLVRKRYAGDTQAPMATRTTGINAGARSLVYADGALLSTLVNNNNGNGSPQWFMVTPEEVDRIDVMTGPFSAAYPGNSYGAVTEITTRMPEKFEATIGGQVSSQRYAQLGMDSRFNGGRGDLVLGNRHGPFSWRFSGSHLGSSSQPLSILVVNQSGAAGGAAPVVGGALPDRNRSGGPTWVLGAGGLTHTAQDTARIRLGYDLTPTLRATWSTGVWQNKAKARSESGLRDAAGNPWFGAAAGNVNIGGQSQSAGAIGALFNSSMVEQEHWMHSLSLATIKREHWNGEINLSRFSYARDLTRQSTGLYPLAASGGAGRIADASGTGWDTIDVKGSWQPDGARSVHRLRFGLHRTQVRLSSPMNETGDWVGGSAGKLFSDSRGTTTTTAIWLQDAWRLRPDLTVTLGARQEFWKAFDGYNFTTVGGNGFSFIQPALERSGLSPKASLQWQASSGTSITASLARALRFPTVGELYQTLSTGTIATQANPFLRPEDVVSSEIAAEWRDFRKRLRISLFHENVRDALVSQTSTVAGFAAPVSFVQNVDRTRQRGIELALEKQDLLTGIDLAGSLTWVDARIMENSTYVPASPGASSIGKRTPHVPEWRASAALTWRPDARWSGTLAARYSSRLFATVDNTDTNPSAWQGFDQFVVVDLRVRARLDRHLELGAGVDNLLGKNYFLFHPFPSRTLSADLRYRF
ncbi:TonB-dependent receptor [Lacisediminimonas profundi]|uniref:TonB-dependent receptor n=1 Tax=Lacisediminimonas profundi TaxID=2603856 RepID=UPI00124B1525|nr:TonB-dependent receptor [Lacisediminimonas profundi]